MKVLLVLLLLFLQNTKAFCAQQITVACDLYPPYQFRTHNELKGFSVEVVENILKEMKVEIKNGISVLPWKRALGMFERGAVDALFSINFTEERSVYAYYPNEPLVVSPWVLWVTNPVLRFNSLSDLQGKRVGIVRGYSYTKEFMDFLEKEKNFEEAVDDESNFKKLKLERIKYVVAELENGYHILSALKIQGVFPLLDKPVKTDGFYIAFNKKTVSRAFVDEFSERLRKYRLTEAYRLIRQKYLKRQMESAF